MLKTMITKLSSSSTIATTCNNSQLLPASSSQNFARPALRPPRYRAMASASASSSESPLLRSFLSAVTKPYLEKNQTAVLAMKLIQDQDGEEPLCFDHFAFRTFGIDGCGISSIAQLFLDLGYEARDELRFPAKKLRALWFAPPGQTSKGAQHNELFEGPLPRIFISELLVEELSNDAQTVISKYTRNAAQLSKHAAIASILNSLPWPTPSAQDYKILARESEYAAWTLVNGYALNHLTISVHQLRSQIKKITELNNFLQAKGIKLNSEGGILKVSPDGGLLQSSTVADSVLFSFAGDEILRVPASYIEFAERLVLEKYLDLPASEIQEWHRREGFEVGNADKIFESTSSNQTGVH
ncbi:hypothetical protein GOP47_0018596 [Adiantum capillus-veneris]|uniref:2-oxoadipate dioxygenase/decarboxylase n=1 Tax=Adiantum capillus-veneris TaxID=13818 RepID=A0A9D4UE05_ADICA|nr:hypothetical protein GOP47_0018596 [Adiantum capillus-veneris]